MPAQDGTGPLSLGRNFNKGRRKENPWSRT